MGQFFLFEADFVESLRCIPMQVRMNLDTCGVKLKLAHWNLFSADEKSTLVSLACTTPHEVQAYHDWLQNLVMAKTGTPASELPRDNLPLWLDIEQIPEVVQTKAAELNLPRLTAAQWQALKPLERFALIKLSRPSHENHNFAIAWQEFGLGGNR